MYRVYRASAVYGVYRASAGSASHVGTSERQQCLRAQRRSLHRGEKTARHSIPEHFMQLESLQHVHGGDCACHRNDKYLLLRCKQHHTAWPNASTQQRCSAGKGDEIMHTCRRAGSGGALRRRSARSSCRRLMYIARPQRVLHLAIHALRVDAGSSLPQDCCSSESLWKTRAIASRNSARTENEHT